MPDNAMSTTESQPALPLLQRRWYQLSLRPLLLTLLLMFLFIGVAEAIRSFAIITMANTVGTDWWSRVRHGLIDHGMPEWLVCGWVAFALIDSAEWIALFVISLCLGLIRSRKAHSAAWLLIIASPCQKLLSAAIIGPILLSRPNVLIVWLLIIPIGGVGWWISFRLRGHAYDRAKAITPIWLAATIQVVLVVVLLSAAFYGWTAIAECASVATNPEFPRHP
jgi:hypothetical protein